MRSLLVTALIVILTAQVSFAQIDYDRKFYQDKVAKFYKMKRTGTAMVIGGTALTVAGVALIASADWYTEPATGSGYGSNQSTTTTDDPEGLVGVLGVIAGVPLTAVGIVLSTIGSKKEKEYQKKISASYFQKEGAHGLRVRIRL